LANVVIYPSNKATCLKKGNKRLLRVLNTTYGIILRAPIYSFNTITMQKKSKFE